MAGPFSPQPTLSQSVAEKAVSIKNATISALKGEKIIVNEKSNFNLDSLINIISVMLGGIAIILAVIGFARKEPMRVAGGAAVLGGGAIAFQFAALALGAIIFAILVAAILDKIGINI